MIVLALKKNLVFLIAPFQFIGGAIVNTKKEWHQMLLKTIYFASICFHILFNTVSLKNDFSFLPDRLFLKSILIFQKGNKVFIPTSCKISFTDPRSSV